MLNLIINGGGYYLNKAFGEDYFLWWNECADGMNKLACKSNVSRLSQLSDQLERLAAVDKRLLDLEQLRYVTLKMHHLLQTTDKGKKESVVKICEKIGALLNLLENCSDFQVLQNVLGCLLELLNAGKKSFTVLGNNGCVDVLLKMLKLEISDSPNVEEMFALIHSVLAKIAVKDRKFPVKFRLTGCLQITIEMIKQNVNNFKVLHPSLLVMKHACGSSVNCSVLNKAGFINILFRILSNCGHRKITTLKLVLDLIAVSVKSKGAAVKAVNINGVEILLKMFVDWHRTDHHNRQTAIRKALLNSLKALVSTKAGKSSFLKLDGMKTLYVSAIDTNEKKEFGLNSVIVQILRLCMPDNNLPLTDKNLVVRFDLPTKDDRPISADDQDPVSDSTDNGSDEEDSSPLFSEEDNFSLAESQDDSEGLVKQEEISFNKESPTKRTRSDLITMYEHFFPEMGLLKEKSTENGSEDDASTSLYPSIVIPTASTDLSQLYCNNKCSDTSDEISAGYLSERREVSSSTSLLLETSRTLAEDTVTENFDRWKCRSFADFVQKAFPDIYGHMPPLNPEPLYSKKPGISRSMLLKDFERVLNRPTFSDRVVYDLDSLRNCTGASVSSFNVSCQSSDIPKCSSKVCQNKSPVLSFESRFECGNLRKAIQINEREYDLILNSDINCKIHHQWFYFEVRNMEKDVPYKFNIINCEKVNSQFNFGMQPVLYSCKDAEDGDPGWIRTGTDICYYKNRYKRSCPGRNAEKEGYYYTLTFTINFTHADDSCYLAYHYPYSFSLLQNHLERHENRLDSRKIFYERQVLCDSLSGNPCYVVTITSPTLKEDTRSYIFLTSRVHPGESNASWVMKGVFDFLLSNKITAKMLREMYIFKIIPMLNPDGVINGCHRCSLSGSDLNRQWMDPDPTLYPTIYHAKGLLLYLQTMHRKPLVFCDFHGHSRKKNIFMYGCRNSTADLPVTIVTSGSESDSSNVEEAKTQEASFRTLPRILHSIAPSFTYQNCNFDVATSKETTARVVVWREFDISRSYTMESTYCGADQGPYKGMHLGTKELEEMGRCFCAGLVKLGNSASITALLDVSSNVTLDELDSDENDLVLPRGDVFAPVATYPYEGQDYATQLLV
ncbi:cytosolic carboxypeptidase 1-like [Xenia sp. Carnegie-2017]|uniref:cytosolic carboxypeptidase 1-like n=1 Tax=Xenia sp. Carnegie-2017 TaxID=2897299 RepID=UPI001F04C5ED|nr:cytosolic carboxypeptidase 1-like [Xenia sp. Carnegie-2017]